MTITAFNPSRREFSKSLLASTAGAWLAGPAWAGQQPDGNRYTQIHAFDVDGSAPNSALIEAADGHFYGVAYNGGDYDNGTVYRTNKTGKTKVLHSFGPAPFDGAHPSGSLLQASDGNFYGTTEFGGLHSLGTLFKMTPAGAITVMNHFGLGPDGARPRAKLIQASDGKLYGTTRYGGVHNLGLVFVMDLSGGYHFVWHFEGPTGGEPIAGLVEATDGLLYGATVAGGATDVGVLFVLDTTTGDFQVLHHFDNSNGANPVGTPIQGSDGHLYGTTAHGGSYNEGVIFQLTLAGVITVLHDFRNTDGRQPQCSLVQDPAGNLIGTTASGGALDVGTVFRLKTNGKLETMHSFTNADTGSYVDGANPAAPPALTANGLLIGTTSAGGLSGAGTLYRLQNR